MRNLASSEWAERVVDAVLLSLAGLQLWGTLAIRLGVGFHGFLVGVPVALGLAVLVTRALPLCPAPDPTPEGPDLPLQPLLGSAAIAAVAVGVYGLGWLPYLAVWAVVSAHLVYAAVRARRPPSVAETDADRRGVAGALVGVALGAAAGTLVVNRPDGDDGFYLAQVSGTLAHPDLPVLSFDTMHGDLTAPVQQPGHRAQLYETLVAAVAWALPFLEPADVYYFVFPVLSAWLFALATGLLARELVGSRVAAAALVGALLLALLWGGTWITPANFGLSRLFQGKSVFVFALVPLVVLTALRFARAPDVASWVRLAAAMLASAAASSSALVLAPLGGALVVLGTLGRDRRSGLAAAGGIAAAVPLVVMLLLVKLEVDAADFDSVGRTKGLDDVLGPGARVPLALLALVVLPLVVRGRRGALWLSRYLALVSVAVLNGGTAALLALLGGSLFSWRTYWSVPLLTWVALALGAAWFLPGRARPWGRVGVVAWLLAFALAGPWIGAAENDATWGWPRWDVEPAQDAIGLRIVEAVPPEAMVLAHHEVAIRTTRHVRRPSLIGVRKLYLGHLDRHFGKQEVRQRQELLAFTTCALKPHKLDWAVGELDRRCITALAANRCIHRRYPGAGEKLEARGWRLDLEAGDHELWLRPDCPPVERATRRPRN